MCVTFQQKMEAMAQEADELKRSDQTFQRWLGDQILRSAEFLDIRFVEEVISYTMRMAQKIKLEQLFENVQAVGRNDPDKAWLAERAE